MKNKQTTPAKNVNILEAAAQKAVREAKAADTRLQSAKTHFKAAKKAYKQARKAAKKAAKIARQMEKQLKDFRRNNKTGKSAKPKPARKAALKKTPARKGNSSPAVAEAAVSTAV